MKIEKLIADTINDNPLQIEIRGQKIDIPRPTVGTIIEVSKHISEFPEMPQNIKTAAIVPSALNIAKDCGKLGEIMAILMLGKKGMYTEFRLFGRTIYRRNNVKRLATELEHLTTEEYANILITVFKGMNLSFFLNIIISLQDINQLKKTKTEATASGQSSETSSKTLE